jgi:hypothetical protein
MQTDIIPAEELGVGDLYLDPEGDRVIEVASIGAASPGVIRVEGACGESHFLAPDDWCERLVGAEVREEGI